MISNDDKKFLLGIKAEDIDFKLLVDLFASKAKKINGKITTVKPRMRTGDTMVLMPGEYFNKTKITTNPGLFIFNKLIIERDLQDIVGYWNVPINNKQLKAIEKLISVALINDKIKIKTVITYYNRIQWFGMKFNTIVSGSFTMNTLKPNTKVMKMRDDYIKKNKEKIEEGDIPTAIKLENLMKDAAKKELADDSGMDLYQSEARGAFGNNYKNISLMKGPVNNPIENKTEVITTNFMEGIAKKDLAIYANGVIAGAYPKAVGTQKSGHLGKQLIAALQSVTIDKKVKDCGTVYTNTVNLTSSNINDYLFRFIVEGNKIILIDHSNKDKYINRTVKMRTPMGCIGNNLCLHCAGDIGNKMNVTNIGLTSTRAASTILLACMKKFHDTTAKMNEIDTNNMIL